MKLRLVVPVVCAVIGVGPVAPALSQDGAVGDPAPSAESSTEPQSCSDCHNGHADSPTLGPPEEMLAQSVHSSLDCTSCHNSISMDDLVGGTARPHGADVDPVDCGECHDEEAEVYQRHGRMALGKDPDLPRCWSCHGTHDVLPVGDLHSHVHPSNLARTCMNCHMDVDLVREHETLADQPISLYESSVHGRASKKGLRNFANCNHCHSSPGPDGVPTAHRILGPADPDSTIYHFSIPDTCGRCHEPITADYWEGIHGILVKRGSVDSPVCTTCHGEHGIISPSDPASPVSAAKVAEQTCTPCHESVILNERFGIPGGRLRSYVDSYHGHKSRAGDVHVANCASCHGAHRILPSTDPTSSIHANNLQETCGECHPGISPELAKTGIHTTVAGQAATWADFFRKLYIVLIVATIGLMLLHNGAHWIRRVKQMGTHPFIVRLTINETMQHWALAISFTVLVISGFALRFSESWWVQFLFGWGDGKGFESRGTVHRTAAVVMILVSVWHMVYLLTQRGRHMMRAMLPGKSDLVHAKENALYILGMRDREPRFARFTYMEKAEYWALVWGTIIMTGTGIVLVFDNYFSERWSLPKGFLDVMLVIHYYEAWLATLAILVWHIYGTVFSPSVYPMNPAWMAGRMPKTMYEHEHPEGPRLKVRMFRSYYEDEESQTGASSGSDAEAPLSAEEEPREVRTR